MSFLATDAALLLVYKDMPYITKAQRYDLMLTPQFYVFKKESLPVKYHYQAMKLAPSVLEELTGAGEYSYAAIKEENGWALIAYDMKKIENFLEEKGLARHLINKIYFAQQAKEQFSYPLAIDEKNALVTVDDTVVILPKRIIGVDEYAILSNEFRPTKGISASQVSVSWLGKREATTLTVLLVLLAIIYTVEGIKYQQGMRIVEEKINQIKEQYPKLDGKSSMVLNSLYESNYAIDNLQRKMRDRLKTISQMTSKASKIDKLSIDKNGYEVIISTDAKNLKKIKEYAVNKQMKPIESKVGLMLKGAL